MSLFISLGLFLFYFIFLFSSHLLIHSQWNNVKYGQKHNTCKLLFVCWKSLLLLKLRIFILYIFFLSCT